MTLTLADFQFCSLAHLSSDFQEMIFCSHRRSSHFRKLSHQALAQWNSCSLIKLNAFYFLTILYSDQSVGLMEVRAANTYCSWRRSSNMEMWHWGTRSVGSTGGRWMLDWMTLVVFSNLNDSVYENGVAANPCFWDLTWVGLELLYFRCSLCCGEENPPYCCL